MSKTKCSNLATAAAILAGADLEWMSEDHGFRPMTIPAMSAECWQKMPEVMFRDLMVSGVHILCSRRTWDVILERARSLGIEL